MYYQVKKHHFDYVKQKLKFNLIIILMVRSGFEGTVTSWTGPDDVAEPTRGFRRGSSLSLLLYGIAN